MMFGRIETYTHSDSINENTKCCVVKVMCQSNEACKTDEFKSFCKKLAMISCGCMSGSYDYTIKTFPEIETERRGLERILKEKISVELVSFIQI